MENWYELEFLLLKIIRLQPSELDRLEFYRAEMLIENLKNYSEKENDQRKKEESEQQNKNSSLGDATSMMKNAQRSLPKFSSPKMPSFNPGKMKF